MYKQDWDPPTYSGSPFSLTPWVRRLLIANTVVFLLRITVFPGAWFLESFGFSPGNFLQQPWSVVTYMFVHGGILHLAFNMLMLFFFGPHVEERMGSSAFARYFFFCGLGAAAFAFLISFVWTVNPFIGASAAVFGVALAFALNWPNHEIYVFPLPFPIKAKWLVIGLATMDLTFELLRANTGIAHLAHIGGFVFGWLYLRGIPKMAERAATAQPSEAEARVLVHPSAEPEMEAGERHPTPAGRKAEPTEPRAEMDRLLDKISQTGMASLTSDEKQVLQDMSRTLRDD